MSMRIEPLSKQERFERDVRQVVRAAVKRYREDGTISMSADCLWGCIKVPTANGPQGINAAYVARRVFNEVIKEHEFEQFVSL